MTIQLKEKYELFILNGGVGANDKVADSINSYVSYLNSVARHLNISISPETLNSESDVNRLSAQLMQSGLVSRKTVNNYKSAMRQYVKMVGEPDTPSELITPDRSDDVNANSNANNESLKNMSEKSLLQLHGEITKELRNRGVVRTNNNPLGDYTEWMVAKALGLALAANSKAGYDGISESGVKVQIKGRRITPDNNSRQLSAIRKYDENDFDELAAVVFDEKYNVLDALLIPHSVVGEYARYRAHVNAHILTLQGPILSDPRVKSFKDRLT